MFEKFFVTSASVLSGTGAVLSGVIATKACFEPVTSSVEAVTR